MPSPLALHALLTELLADSGHTFRAQAAWQLIQAIPLTPPASTLSGSFELPRWLSGAHATPRVITFGSDPDIRLGPFRLRHRPGQLTICRDAPLSVASAARDSTTPASRDAAQQVYLCYHPTRLTLRGLYRDTGFHWSLGGFQLALQWRQHWKTPD